MAKSRTEKAALNTITAAIGELIHLICTLILTRLVLTQFGSAYNGITTSVRQFLSSISILTIGISATTRVALYQSLEAHDLKQTSGIIKATEKYMKKVGIVLFGLLAVLTIVYPFAVDTGYRWIEVAPLIIAAGISAAGRFLFGTTYGALVSADQSIYISNIFGMIANILNLVVSVILIKLGCNVQVVKLGASFFLMLNPIMLGVYVKRKYKLEKNCEPVNPTSLRQRDVMAHSIANIIHDHTDMVVLTVFCDVKIVSVYTIYNLILNALKKTQYIFTSGTEALFGNMWVRKEIDKIRLNLGYYEYIMASFVSIIFSTSLVMILPFVSLYTSGVDDVEYILPVYAAVIMIGQVFFSFRAPYLTLVQGVGRYKETKKGAYLEAFLNLLISVVLVQFIGIVGVAVGTLVANLFRTVQYAIYIDNNIIRRGKMIFVKRIIWSLVNVLIIYFICRGPASYYAYLGWAHWIVTGFVVTLISVAVTVLSSLLVYRGDFIGVSQLALRVIKRKRKA